VTRQVVEQEPLNPISLKPELADDLVAICVQCLQKAPGQRYASAGLLADDLEQWLQGNPVAAKSGRRQDRSSSSGLRIAGLFAVVGMLIAGALYVIFPPPLPQAPDQPTRSVAQSPISKKERPPEAVMNLGPALALLSDTFEISTETFDKSQNVIKRGNDPATGLPREIREPRTGMHFILVPVGEFTKGELKSKENEKSKPRRIKRPYYVGKYEVTIDEFRIFAEAKKYATHQQGSSADMHYPFKRKDIAPDVAWNRLPWVHTGRHPLSLIRHTDVEAFLTWLNEDAVGSFDVPTEIEWEYAARGGPGAPYLWKSKTSGSDERANLQDVTYFAAILKLTGRRPTSKHGYGKGRNDGHPFTAPVGSYESNPLGLYDIVGNVREMCRLSKERWGFRGWCFNSGGTGRPLLERQTHDPVESSFMLGCRLIWRIPESAFTNASRFLSSAPEIEIDLVAQPVKSVGVERLDEKDLRGRYPGITQGYTKPIPGMMNPRLPSRIPPPNYRPLETADLGTMRLQADKYASDHPTFFRSIVERYEQVWVGTPQGSERDTLLKLIQKWVVKMDQAAQKEREKREQEMNILADLGDFRSAFLVWADMSAELRPFKDEASIFRLIEARVPAAHHRPVQPGELDDKSAPPDL
jgi:formylglycine-generating enzyme required for sulfatase activity